MLKGLAQFCVALAEFLEQPHVFDGNDRLVGEGFEQLNLLVGERTRLNSSNEDRAHRRGLPEQRDGKDSPGYQPTLTCPGCGLGKLGIQVRDVCISMNFLPVDYGSPSR